MKKQLLLFVMLLLPMLIMAETVKIDKLYYYLDNYTQTAGVTYSGQPYNNAYTGHYGGAGLRDADIEIPSTITYNDIIYTVTAIGDYAFYDVESAILMSSISLPSTVTYIGKNAFARCTGLTSIEIPNSVTSIGYSSFYGCSGLTSVTIGNSVTSIGDYAFYDCNSLTSVTVENPVPVSNGGDSFSNRANATLYVPYGSKAAYEATEDWKKFKEIIEVMPMKCATPTITIVDGKVSFDCETPEVTFKWNYSFDSGNAENEGNNPILSGTNTCHISVYATRDGYVDSDVATADVEVYWGKKGDVNQDGVVTITDAVSVVNIIHGQ